MPRSVVLRELQRWLGTIQSLVALTSELDPTARIVQQFRDAGAVAPERAQRFHATSTLEEQSFAALLRCGGIRQPRPGRYYLDERRIPMGRLDWWHQELE